MAKRALKINEEDFPSNSNVKKVAPMRDDDRKPVEETEVFAVSKPKKRNPNSRKAVLKKRSLAQNIASMFVGSDENVAGYILNEVLIPAAKNTIQEMVQSGIEMLLFGERRERTKDRGSTKVSYGRFYKDREERRERPRASYRDKFDLSDIFFKDGRDADDALRELCDMLEEYDHVSVADFFDVAGISGASWAHNKYGWTDLRSARCTHTRGGWQIMFPDPEPLD